MDLRLNGLNPLSYVGVNPYTPPGLIVKDRAPTSTDSQNFELGTFWLDSSTEDLWVLVSLALGVATWVLLTGGAGTVISLTGNVGGPVSPLAGNINVVGDGTSITVTGNPATHTLTISTVSGGVVVETLTGDTGGPVSPTAGNINIITNVATTNAGATVEFNGAGSTLTFNDTDANNNVLIGKNAGNATLTSTNLTSLGLGTFFNVTSSSNSVAVGALSLFSATSGNGNNTAVGVAAGEFLLTGAENCLYGVNAGISYVAAESSNIIIGNAGVVGDNNTIRIGTQGGAAGQQNKAFMAGINGVTVATPALVTIDTGTNQLGTTAFTGVLETLTGDVGGPVSPTANNINIITDVAAINAGATVEFDGSGSTLTYNNTDASSNVLIGRNAGNATLTASNLTSLGVGSFNVVTSSSNSVAVGVDALSSITSGGGNNTAVGPQAGSLLLTGSDSIFIGNNAGVNFVAAESSNIIIGNDGVIGDTHTIRIGTQGGGAAQQNKAFLAGVNGVTVGAPTFVTIDTGTNQLGVSDGTIMAVGPWTPQITVGGSSTGITYNMANTFGFFQTFINASGSLRLIFVSCSVAVTSIGILTGNISLTNLPQPVLGTPLGGNHLCNIIVGINLAATSVNAIQFYPVATGSPTVQDLMIGFNDGTTAAHLTDANLSLPSQFGLNLYYYF